MFRFLAGFFLCIFLLNSGAGQILAAETKLTGIDEFGTIYKVDKTTGNTTPRFAGQHLPPALNGGTFGCRERFRVI